MKRQQGTDRHPPRFQNHSQVSHQLEQDEALRLPLPCVLREADSYHRPSFDSLKQRVLFPYQAIQFRLPSDNIGERQTNRLKDLRVFGF